jgi:hypothetical protein
MADDASVLVGGDVGDGKGDIATVAGSFERLGHG